MARNSKLQPLYPFPADLSPEELAERFAAVTSVIVDLSEQLKNGCVTVVPTYYFSEKADRILSSWFESPEWYADNSLNAFDRFVGAMVADLGFVEIAEVRETLRRAACDITPGYVEESGCARIEVLCSRMVVLYEFLAAQTTKRKARKPRKQAMTVVVGAIEPESVRPTDDDHTGPRLAICTYANEANPKLVINMIVEGLKLYDELLRRRGLRPEPLMQRSGSVAITNEVHRRLLEVFEAKEINGGEKHNMIARVIKETYPRESGFEITWR